MKKLIIILTAAVLTACNKESGNTGVMKEDTATVSADTPKETTYRYVAEDGSSAHVAFGEATEGKYISIRSNNKTIRVKHDSQTDTGDVYREHDITVTSNDSLVVIDQGGTLIELKKARGQ